MNELSGIERDDREDREAARSKQQIMTPIQAKVYIQRQKQQVDVALALAISYTEWQKGELQGINIKRAVELTKELFDELETKN